MDDLNVICVLWRGDFRDRDYSLADVERLYAMCRKNITKPFTFICLTNIVSVVCNDRITGINFVPLKYPDELKGWWAKLELFRSDLGLTGKNLYIDLDVFITGNLDELFDYEGIYFAPPIPPFPTAKNTVNRFQSSVIFWDTGFRNLNIPFIIKNGSVDGYRGDQDFFGSIFSNSYKFSRRWFEKLRTCCASGPKKDVKFVLGNPKPMYKKILKEKPEWLKKLI